MTSDLISREDAIMALTELSEHYTEKGKIGTRMLIFMIEAIKELPSVERKLGELIPPEAVKHGRWIHWYGYITIYKYRCSICGAYHRVRYDYCPPCGACMDAETCNNTERRTDGLSNK